MNYYDLEPMSFIYLKSSRVEHKLIDDSVVEQIQASLRKRGLNLKVSEVQPVTDEEWLKQEFPKAWNQVQSKGAKVEDLRIVKVYIEHPDDQDKVIEAFQETFQILNESSKLASLSKAQEECDCPGCTLRRGLSKMLEKLQGEEGSDLLESFKDLKDVGDSGEVDERISDLLGGIFKGEKKPEPEKKPDQPSFTSLSDEGKIKDVTSNFLGVDKDKLNVDIQEVDGIKIVRVKVDDLDNSMSELKPGDPLKLAELLDGLFNPKDSEGKALFDDLDSDPEDVLDFPPGAVVPVSDSWKNDPLSGGNTDYYLVQVDFPQRLEQAPYQAECEDIIQALNLTFDEANIFKEIWRTANARQGNGKPGNSTLRAAQKIHHYAKRILSQAERSSK